MALFLSRVLLGRHCVSLLRPVQRLRIRQKSDSSSSWFSWSEVHPFNAIRVRLGATGTGANKIIDTLEFRSLLSSNVTQWKKENRSAVWLHVPVQHSSLVHHAHEEGFYLHHAIEGAERIGGEIVLSLWLDDSRPCKLPPFASHQVGVCGVVVTADTEQVLVVQDKYKPAKWKFPGGLSEFGEDIAQTAEREVLEETGVVSEFQSVLAFRQHHNIPSAFGQSDLYFICRMIPLSTALSPCRDEVSKCEWITLKELQLSPQATPLSNRIGSLLHEGMSYGFDKVDINMEEVLSVYQGFKNKLYVRRTLKFNL